MGRLSVSRVRFVSALVFVAAVIGVLGTTVAIAVEDLVVLPIYTAIRHGDCSKAIKAVNDLIHSHQNAQVDFIAARMADEGVCANPDQSAAAAFYKGSFELGNRTAGLEYGAKVGMGEGAAQSYEAAGQIRRTAGLNAAGQLSVYSLGYVCTLRGVAGKMLRQSFPKGAIARGGGTALVSVTASSGALQIRSLPHVGMADAQVGSYIQHPMIDARDEIKNAWQKAMMTVPKPDAARLEGKTVDLSLDLEMTIEVGSNAAPGMQGGLLRGDL